MIQARKLGHVVLKVRDAQKSKDFAAGAAPSVEWNAEDRAAAKEDEVKQRNNGQQNAPSQRSNH